MIYEYECTNEECKHQWEAEQSMTDPVLTHCESCQQETAKKLISKSSFVLKGSGWASDNYK
jgi:putative FmdB family regulatory protein